MSDKITLLAFQEVAHQYSVTLENVKGCVTGALSWRVTYGEEVTTWHRLKDAVKRYNESTAHQLHCASLTDE